MYRALSAHQVHRGEFRQRSRLANGQCKARREPWDGGRGVTPQAGKSLSLGPLLSCAEVDAMENLNRMGEGPENHARHFPRHEQAQPYLYSSQPFCLACSRGAPQPPGASPARRLLREFPAQRCLHQLPTRPLSTLEEVKN